MIKRILIVLPGLILTIALLGRLYMSNRATKALNDAWLRGQQAGLLVNTANRTEVVPQYTKGNTGRALGMYAAAIALMPTDGVIQFKWLPKGDGLKDKSAGKLDSAAIAELNSCLKQFDPALELVEKGAATDYRLQLSCHLLPDVGRRLRQVDGLGLEAGSRSVAGLWSLQSLLRGRAMLHLQEGAANEAMRSAVVALRLLDYSVSHRRLTSEAMRQAMLIDVANTISLIAEKGKPSLELCQIALTSLKAVPYWDAMKCSVQGTTYDDMVQLYEEDEQSQLWKPWVTLKEANYLQHMASFYESLCKVEKSAQKGEAWGSQMAEVASRYYVKSFLEDSVNVRVALDLAMLRVAQPIVNHRSMGAKTSVDDISEDLIALRHRVDPWSGLSYRAEEDGGKLSFFSVGSKGKKLYYPSNQ